jgi:AcrR family transcriptional regulator
VPAATRPGTAPGRATRPAASSPSSTSPAARSSGAAASATAAPAYHHGALRAALLDAAEAILEEGGVEAFTLRECARRAGVSHAAPAHHFGDARGLLSACAAGGFARLSALMTDYMARVPDDPDARLMATGQAYIDFALAHRALFQLMFRRDRLADTHAELADSGSGAFGCLQHAMAASMAAHGVPPDEAPTRSLFAWSMVHGYATLVLEGQCEHGYGLAHSDPQPARAMGAALLGLAGRAMNAPG